MKNKIELKHSLLLTLIIVIASLITFSFLTFNQYQKYTLNYNAKINSIIMQVKEKYPNITEKEIIDILNGNNTNETYLDQYGIDITLESAIKQNDLLYKKFLIINLSFLSIVILSLLSVFLRYNYKKNKTLKEITAYISAINKKNYQLTIDDNTEDELSILKNEVYKTMINLKEQAENSMQDKINLKNSLSDISHQLKTPLTSIMINLDNILDNPDMETERRTKFIFNIKREISNINFLVQALLKLSKFDANTIIFNNEEHLVKNIINKTIQNVESLSDLKNVTIKVKGNKTDKLVCDASWQIEALTNILKNSIEYSSEDSKIEIEYEQNKVYTLIKIIDYGKGIDKKELSNIFKRFYKMKGANDESVGIGMNLAKTIIEANNGRIDVESTLNEGTTFIIKYYS